MAKRVSYGSANITDKLAAEVTVTARRALALYHDDCKRWGSMPGRTTNGASWQAAIWEDGRIVASNEGIPEYLDFGNA